MVTCGSMGNRKVPNELEDLAGEFPGRKCYLFFGGFFFSSHP